MNINLELYKVFLSVAKNGNITKAANELMISQPGVSKSIKNLEEQLNCSLFVRTKSGVYLTEEGHFILNVQIFLMINIEKLISLSLLHIYMYVRYVSYVSSHVNIQTPCIHADIV